MIVLLVIVGIPLLMWGYSSWRKSHEERILAGIVAKGGQFTRSTTPFQQWVSQFTLLGRRLKFEGVPSDFTIPEPTDEELAYVGGMRLTHGVEIIDGQIDTRLLTTLAKLPKLHSLVLINCSVGDQELERIIEKIPRPEKLGTLHLQGTTLTDQGLTSIQRLKELQTLMIDESNIDGSGFLKLEAKYLSSLGLMNSQVNDANLKFIVECLGNRLHGLDLTNSRISDAGLRELVRTGRLMSLAIGGTSVKPDGVREFLDERYRLEVQQIRQLSLAGFPWTIEDLKNIRLPDNLHKLDLTGWVIHDADLDQLPNLKNLEILNLSRTRVTDAGLPALMRFQRLRRLHLRGTKVTNAGLDIALELPCTSFLEVGETAITFEGLMARKYPSGRMQLDVSGMNLTLEEIRSLTKRRPEGVVYQNDRTFKEY